MDEQYIEEASFKIKRKRGNINGRFYQNAQGRKTGH